MAQLELYHRMRCPDDVLAHPMYQRWCWERERKESLGLGQPPGSGFIIFEDEMKAEEGRGEEGQGEEEAKVEEYRCRRCRTPLGNSTFRVEHEPRLPPRRQNHPPTSPGMRACLPNPALMDAAYALRREFGGQAGMSESEM